MQPFQPALTPPTGSSLFNSQYSHIPPCFLPKPMEFQADSATFAAKIKVSGDKKQALQPFLDLAP